MTILLLLQLAGEILSRLAEWPIPGPVVGMALLLVVLRVRPETEEELASVSNGLLSHLSLLFVPAGVGIMLHAPRLAAEWPALAIALPASTAAAIAVTGLLAQGLRRRGAREEVAP